MVLEGERFLPLPPAKLWPILRDASYLVQCIPDATITESANADRASCMVRPGLSFVRSAMEVTVEILEALEPSLVRYRQTSKGIGTSSEVETAVELTPQDVGTRIRWRAEIIKLGGLLKAVPSGLIRGAAQRVIEDLWLGIEKLAESTGDSKKNPVR